MSPLSFEVRQGVALEGVLVFSDLEHSFRFETGSIVDLGDRTGTRGNTSLSVGTLQIELDVESGRVLFVWGLHPRNQWRVGSVLPDRAHPGAVYVASAPELLRGVSVSIADVGVWTTVHDPSTGWIRVASDENSVDDDEVAVATSTLIGLQSGRLNSVWLQPIFDD